MTRGEGQAVCGEKLHSGGNSSIKAYGLIRYVTPAIFIDPRNPFQNARSVLPNATEQTSCCERQGYNALVRRFSLVARFG
jgi:hypothetical protein